MVCLSGVLLLGDANFSFGAGATKQNPPVAIEEKIQKIQGSALQGRLRRKHSGPGNHFSHDR